MKLITTLGWITLAAAPASAQFTLSEIYVNAPGADNGQEGVEIRGAPSAALTGYTLLVLDGDGTSSGVVDQALDLSAFSTGTNGLFLWRDSSAVISPAPDPATTINVADFNPDLENGSITFILGTGTVPAVGTDLDADNDGTFDVGALSGFTVADAVSWLETDGASNFGYADDVGFTVIPLQTFTPDAVYRVYDGAGVPLRWSAGDVLGTNPGGPYAWDLAGAQFYQLGSCGLDLGVLNVNVPDSDGDGVPNTCDPLTGFCFGDGTGTACPCGNAGAAGNGCASSLNAAGANLATTGAASTTADTLVLVGSGMPNSSALYFQGTTQIAGGAGSVFGDGLRCAGGAVIRLGTKTNVAGTSSYPETGDLSISVKGVVPGPGALRTYQCWYRNAAAFCSPDTFNLTNGVSVIWS